MIRHRLTITCCWVLMTGTLFAEGFPVVKDTEPTSQALSDPQAATAGIELPPGFRATLFAAEPDVRQPIAIATDARGRLWVAENYTYAESGKNFDTNYRDRIVILEDRDHDGRHDRRTVFCDRLSKLTSVEVGFGGVWALCAPHLLFIPDADRDDKPDGEPIVILDGWNDREVRHNIVNGLRWGPDGWLYGRHGIQAISAVGPPDEPEASRRQLSCAIWRYHPTRRTIEVVCQGGTNSWGMDWDRHGQMFFINTVIGHLWHVVPGAYYERMYGEHFNPYVYALMPQTADHVHWDTSEEWTATRTQFSDGTNAAGGGHAHSGMMIYQGDNWPESYRGNVFTVNLHGRRLNQDTLQRESSAYVAHHAQDVFQFHDPWFRGIELLIGPDGGVFVADWTDVGECHENDGVHRTSGRIFKLTYGTPPKPQFDDLQTLSNEQLVELQFHQNEWYVRQARRILQERSVSGDVSAIHKPLCDRFAATDDPEVALRCLWALWVTGGADRDWLTSHLRHPSEHVRVWAVKLLTDSGAPPPPLVKVFTDLARTDDSGLVLLQLASALQRSPHDRRWELAAAIGSHVEFAHDRFLPQMLWYGIEPAVPESAAEAVHLVQQTSFPLLQRQIAQRIMTDLRLNPQGVELLCRTLAATEDVALQQQILDGMATAAEGWRQATPPDAWEKQVVARLAESGDETIRTRVREIGAVFGDGRALEELLQIARSDDSSPAARRNALRALVSSRDRNVIPVLHALLKHRDHAVDAIRGLAAFSDPQTADLIITAYPGLRGPARTEAVDTLCSRMSDATKLIDAIEAGKIPSTELTAQQIRQLNSFGDDGITQRLRVLFPNLRHTTADKQLKIAEYRSQLTEDALAAADATRGREIFTRSCAACHVLFGEGGKIGPDLTGGQRANLNYLLENIVDPSAQVTKGFHMSTVMLTDGRVINGVVGHETGDSMTVQTATQRLSVLRSDIEERIDSNLSLMPERLLDVLSAQQTADLIKYLMSPIQVPNGLVAGDHGGPVSTKNE